MRSFTIQATTWSFVRGKETVLGQPLFRFQRVQNLANPSPDITNLLAAAIRSAYTKMKLGCAQTGGGSSISYY